MLSPSDVLGTPYQLILDEETGETVLVHPPTIKFFEALYATYNVTVGDAISPPEDLANEVAYIRVLSRTMQMIHIAVSMVNPEITFNDVELWCREDQNFITRYLQSFARHLPEDKKKTKSAVQVKKLSTPKIWIPR